MINSTLFDPKSILIVGGSQNTGKPGGKIIENLIKSPFKGDLLVINPKADEVQGIKSYASPELCPKAELAILAIPARFCPDTIRQLCIKGTRAFVVISAGFGELNEEGKLLDRKILEVLDEYDASLLGPNCIGLIHQNHHSVFTTPVPDLAPDGVEFISSSGSTAVFVMEAGMCTGIRFSNVYTVGNALQITVEDLMEHLDMNYMAGKSSRVIMIYIENIGQAQKFIKHARSLREKGAQIVALKAGTTDAGNRAASSHTGAMASPTVAVEAMFKKAGVIQCHSRQELLTAAAILQSGIARGENIAVVTHAGGAGVLLTDALEKNGMHVPEISGKKAEELLQLLYPGSTIKNPIDFLATGTADQLDLIIDYCENHFDEIDAIAVIFGSPGLFDVKEVYDRIDAKNKTCKKPIYPILPSPINTAEALEYFKNLGHHYFEDESVFGTILGKVYEQSQRFQPSELSTLNLDKERIRSIISKAEKGYLKANLVAELIEASGIPMVKEHYFNKEEDIIKAGEKMDYPVVMKVMGPVHKSDSGGVEIGISNTEQLNETFSRMMRIKDAEGVLIQPMIEGHEVFIGAKDEGDFGHLILFGMGGIFLEVFKDIQALITPLEPLEIQNGLTKLMSFPILKGIRGQEGISIKKYTEIIERISKLVEIAPEIKEMDLNPLIGKGKKLHVVDARIRI